MQNIPTAGKTVTLKVRYKNFDTITRSHSLAHHTNNAEEISTIAKQLLEQTEAGTREIRLLGISLSNLNLIEKKYWEQLELGV